MTVRARIRIASGFTNLKHSPTHNTDNILKPKIDITLLMSCTSYKRTKKDCLYLVSSL